MHAPNALPRFDFSGARVLVTGATAGIGLGIARAFRDAGAAVCITGTRSARTDYDEPLDGFDYRRMALTDDASIEAVAASLDGLDVLVNNAGANFMREDEYRPEVFEQSVRVNLTSAYRLAHACRPLLARSQLPGGASVICIASMTSYFGVEVVPGYGAAKTGLLGLTRTLAVAWASECIRVNAVAAGLVHSRMTAAMLAHPDASAPHLARTPLGRHGTPEDIAGAVLFLSSAAASWITGQTLAVDGGFSIQG